MRKMRWNDKLIFEVDVDVKIVEIDVNANVVEVDVNAKIVKNNELIFFNIENLIIVFEMKLYFWISLDLYSISNSWMKCLLTLFMYNFSTRRFFDAFDFCTTSTQMIESSTVHNTQFCFKKTLISWNIFDFFLSSSSKRCIIFMICMTKCMFMKIFHLSRLTNSILIVKIDWFLSTIFKSSKHWSWFVIKIAR